MASVSGTSGAARWRLSGTGAQGGGDPFAGFVLLEWPGAWPDSSVPAQSGGSVPGAGLSFLTADDGSAGNPFDAGERGTTATLPGGARLHFTGAARAVR